MILIILWIVLIALGMIMRKSKLVIIMQITFASLMFGFNDGNPDQSIYIQSFEALKSSWNNIFDGNVLFNAFLWLLGKFQNNYDYAIAIMAAISLIILCMGFKYYTDSVALCFSLYFISPLIIDATQIKNFVAMCLWIYFSRFLYQAYIGNNTTVNILKYIIGVIIVSLFHFSFIFTFLYLLILFIGKKQNVKTILEMLLIVSIFVLSLGIPNSANLPIFTLLSTKVDQYSLVTQNNFTRIEVTVVAFMFIFILFEIYKILDKYTWFGETGMYKSTIQFRTFSFKLTLVSLSILLLINYSSEIYRMQRDLLPIYYILTAKYFDNIKNKYSDVVTLVIRLFLAVLIAIWYLYIECIMGGIHFESVFKVFFKI